MRYLHRIGIKTFWLTERREPNAENQSFSLSLNSGRVCAALNHDRRNTREDLESGAQFYESCATGVGDYFLDSILSDLDSLVLFAGVHPIYFGFHRMLSKRFPFGIYYEVEDDVAYIYAILDLRRDPLWIRSQLRREGR